MIIAVLFGGQSSEHPVSLMSVTSLLQNLDKKYTKYLVGITKSGSWYHFSGNEAEIIDGSWEANPTNEEVILSPNASHHGFYQLKSHTIQHVDVIFPVLHGRNGEDGTIQGLCQLNGISCVSCNMTSSAISMDKEFTHIICENAGIKMAKYLVYHRSNCVDYQKILEDINEKFGLPCYVKPAKEGSSFGAHKVHNYDELVKYGNDAFSYDEKILVEEFIDGNEIGCAVYGDGVTGAVDEVIVETEMYGYAEKYDGFKTSIHVPSNNLTKQQADEVNRLGKIIYKAIGCEVMARIDFFASSKGIIFNELNLIPGFTSHSRYPGMFKAVGVGYEELLNRLIEVATKDNKHE